MSLRQRAESGVGLAAFLLFAFAGAAAASQAPRWDAGQLTAFADVIVTGRVIEVRAGEDPSVSAIYTYVTVNVHSVVKGTLPADQIIVKELGGRVGTRGLRRYGHPSFVAGEEVLLFLETRPRDRTLYTVAGWQGKWTLHVAGNVESATRLAQDTGTPERWTVAAIRGLVDRTAAFLDERVAPNTHPADAAGSVVQPFVLFDPGFRFNFLPFVDAQAGGQPGLAGGGLTEIVNSILRWNAAGSSFAFQPGSPNGPARCFNNELGNGRVTISFDDPCGEIDNGGGTLAVGGAYYDTSRVAVVNGIAFYEATEGFVVNNDGGAAAPYLRNANCFSDIQLHELGHVLGLDHSNVFGSVMYPTISGTCSTGARELSADDIRGLLTIYPAPTGITPPATAPVNLAVTVDGTTSIRVSFDPVSNDLRSAPSAATSYRLEFASSPTGPVIHAVSTPTTTVTIPIPPGLLGTFYVAVAGVNSAGSGPASPRVAFTIAGCMPPPAPTALTGSVTGDSATASWIASAGAVRYFVQAGSVPGAADLGTADVGGVTSVTLAGVPAGFRAYVRVAAVNACGGVSAPTPDVLIQ